ncbi:hypothetical protein SSTU70S_05737 [Stutzerimonas stutzeri]
MSGAHTVLADKSIEPDFDMDRFADEVGQDLDRHIAEATRNELLSREEEAELPQADAEWFPGRSDDGLTAEPGERMDVPGIELEEPKAGLSNSKFKIMIVGVVVVALIGFGGVGYFAYKVMAPTPPSESAGISAELRAITEQEVQLGGSGPVSEPALQEASVSTLEQSMLGSAPAPSALPTVAERSPDAAVPAAAQAGGLKDIVVTYAPDESIAQPGVAHDAVQAPSLDNLPVRSTPSFQAETPALSAAISDEEKMYDTLLNRVGGMDVPLEAIKIDQSVIKERVESDRLGRLEGDIKSARESVAGMQGTLQLIQSQVTSLTDRVGRSSADQAALSSKVDSLTSSVKKLGDAQAQELQQIKKALAAVERKAEAASKAAASATVRRETPAATRAAAVPAPEAAPSRQPAPPPAAVSAPVTIPQESRPVTVVASTASAVAPSGAVASTCRSQNVSAIWRVKGVNANHAYVVRTQDDQGILLKVGAAVPGFGVVESLDPAARSVCTTSGLIRR